jgi:hypothetical protein
MMNPKLKRATINYSWSSFTPKTLQASHKKLEKIICKQTTLPNMYTIMLASNTRFTFLPRVCSTSPGNVETSVLKEDASNMYMLSRDIPAQTVIKITPRINPEFFALAKYTLITYKEMLVIRNPWHNS